ncbi:MAG: LysM peptidoglycan-binding domain-containing protein, partial [Bacilli bacterium]
MQIHVVQKGQSLFGISQAYSIPWQEISTANELPDPNALVIGQSLVIPIRGRYHWVQPRQSLYTISRTYGLSVTELARINQINPSAILQVGLRLYIPPQPKPTIDVFAYIEPRTSVTQAQIEEVRNRGRYLTYLGTFSYRVNRDGSLNAPPLDNLPTLARNLGITNAMVLSNLEGGQFSGDLAHAIFTNEAVTDKLLDNIVSTAKEIGYGDIHFDFEFIKPEDREQYNAFLRKAKQRISPEGLSLSTALAPKTSAIQTGTLYEAHDYPAHGQIVTFTALMTYEWGYTYSTPQAVSPIGPVRTVAEYAVSEIPANKILLGQNLYGYDWTAPFQNNGQPAKALSPQQAIALAIRERATIQYNAQVQAPF